MTGRKPIPIALVDNSKCHKTKEQIELRAQGEPSGCTAKLLPPKEMSYDAKKEFKRIVKLYRELDTSILNDLDVSVLSAYCESVSIYKKAQVEYQKKSVVIVNKNGTIQQNPYIDIMDKQSKNITRLAEQLCLSPVGRARMGIINEKREDESDPMAALLKWNGR